MTNITLSVKKAELIFSAAHFLSGFGKCDHLHGHNYITEFEIKGRLHEKDEALIDFNVIKEKLIHIVKPLDHKILIPKKSNKLQYHIKDDDLVIKMKGKEYIFPHEDCFLIDIPATTCEWLTKYMHGKIKEYFSDLDIRVTIEETIGSKATYGDW